MFCTEGWSCDLGPPAAGKFLAIFIIRGFMMKKLSIFVDESGDFGAYLPYSPFYIFTLVFHDQAISIVEDIEHLQQSLSVMQFPVTHCFHAGPIIRREEDYRDMDITERRRCLNKILAFARHLNVTYKSFVVEKLKDMDTVSLTMALTKQLSEFFLKHKQYFDEYEKIIVYYDNGQIELSRILASAFTILLPQAEFRKVIPADYRLFQVADLFCTMQLVALKYDRKCLSKSEELFFGSHEALKKNYLKILSRKEFVD